MAFDITCAVIFLLCVLVGYMKGIIRAAFLVGCVAAAYYLSRPLAPPIGEFLHGWTGLRVNVSLIAGQALAGLGIYAVTSVVSDLVARRIERDEQGVMKGWNRQLGALVGLACGAALIFAAVCVADALVKSMPKRNSYVFRTLRTSRLRRYVSDINPLRKKMDGKGDLLSARAPRDRLCLARRSRQIGRGFTGRRGCCKMEYRARGRRFYMTRRWTREVPRGTRKSNRH